MGTLTPRKTGAIEKEALGTAIEGILVLVIFCLLLAVASAILVKPAVQAELERARVLDLILSAPVPTVPGQTCGALVHNASQANAATAHWEVAHPDGIQPFLVTVTIQRGPDSAVFHWTVDPATRRIISLEKRSICNLP
jgi:hypothetical protein